ncbi:MAG: V-type ATP synthase subunit I [Candidatus Rifleibacteriota bacterium]
MISKMKKLLLAARNSEREKVLSLLKLAEAVHIEPVDPASVKLPPGLSTEIDNCAKAISILEQIDAPENNKLVPPGTPSRLVEEILGHYRVIPELREKLNNLRREVESLSPWGQLGLDDIKYLQENGIDFKFLRGPLDKADEIEADAYTLVRAENDLGFFVAASKTEVKASDAFVEIDTPARDVNAIDNEMVTLERKIEEHEDALACYILRLEDLRKHYLRLLNKKRYSEVESGAYIDESIFVINGWIPEDSVDRLQKAFDEAGLQVGMQVEDPAEEDSPPTLLKNPSWAQAIEPLYEFMGVTPSYNEPDTSGLFLIMLSIFSAFLLADAGYGLLVFIIAAAAYFPLVKKGFDQKALKLGLFIFGAVSVYGLLTNTWFGETYKLFGNYDFDPNTQDGMVLLQGICFLMGVMHLTIGHVIKALRKKIDITILSEVGWIMFLWAMYGVVCSLILKQDFVMPGTWIMPLFKASAVLILLFTAPSWNIFASIGAGLGAILQNASACFSDIVSYIRLWAVGLAGGKVAGAFNNIAAMIPFFFFKLPVYILGHAINIILGVIAILAHGVRLNLLEFSNHLELEWAGRKYDPYKEIK